MTVPGFRFKARALAVQCLLLLDIIGAAGLVTAADSTTTTTVYSTTVLLTLTTTTSSGHTTYATTATTSLSPDTTIHLPPGTPTSTMSVGGGDYKGQTFEQSVLNSTNYYRAQHQAKPLQWSPTLAIFAQKHAEQCVFEHSGGPYGENLALNYQTPTIGVDAWGDEESKYNYGSAHFSEAAGHYTQLVWQNTTRVGCGAVSCDNNADNGAHGWYLVCEYYPAGNVQGQFKYNVYKTGESSDGKPGFGGADSQRTMIGGSRWLMALVAVSSAAAFCML